MKQDRIIAGLVLADQILEYRRPTVIVKVLSNEGQSVFERDRGHGGGRRCAIASHGRAPLLNCMQRMSGIATMTQQFVEAV